MRSQTAAVRSPTRLGVAVGESAEKCARPPARLSFGAARCDARPLLPAFSMAAHLFAVALWCAASAAPPVAGRAPPSGAACGEDGAGALVAKAVRHINEQHQHGFKFKLRRVLDSKYQQVFGGCRVDASLKLVQTKCHVTNPKPHQECVPFRLDERGAVATCSVSLDVSSGVATVSKHRCATRPEHTNAEMAWICPDCPMLSPLDDPMGVKAAHQAVLKFNRESKHPNYFTLMEVSQITGGYIMTIGMLTWLKLALVETDCPRQAENTFAPCAPRCSDQASHVFCQATYYNWQDQIGELACEFYPPRNSASRSPGMPKPTCGPLFHESPEGFACKAQLGIRQPVIHHICPFPLIVQQPRWVKG